MRERVAEDERRRYLRALLGGASEPAQFARWAGCSQFAAAQILRGQREPTPEILGNLAEHLDMPVEALMFEFGVSQGIRRDAGEPRERCPLHSTGRNTACPFLWQAMVESQIPRCPSQPLVAAVCDRAEPLCVEYRPHVAYLAAQLRYFSGLELQERAGPSSFVLHDEDDEPEEEIGEMRL